MNNALPNERENSKQDHIRVVGIWASQGWFEWVNCNQFSECAAATHRDILCLILAEAVSSSSSRSAGLFVFQEIQSDQLFILSGSKAQKKVSASVSSIQYCAAIEALLLKDYEWKLFMNIPSIQTTEGENCLWLSICNVKLRQHAAAW